MKNYTNRLDISHQASTILASQPPFEAYEDGEHAWPGLPRNWNSAVVQNADEGRSPLSVGLEWSARITTIGFEIAVPTLVGWWLDQRYHGNGWILLGGALLGVAVGILHLIQMAVALTKDQKRPDGPTKPDEPANP